MCIPWLNVNRLLFGIVCMVPLLTACPGQGPDNIKPTMTLLGEAERSISQNDIIVEGELEDNTHIAFFSYSLNGGESNDILDTLGKTLYRFIVTDLQQGENIILIKATDSSSNTTTKELKVNVSSLATTSVDGLWQDTDINYMVCSKPVQASLGLDFDETQQSSYLGGSVNLELDGSVILGQVQGYMDNAIINGVLTLSTEQLSVGQIKLNLDNGTLSGTVTFKNAASCTSTSRQDITLDLELTRVQ